MIDYLDDHSEHEHLVTYKGKPLQKPVKIDGEPIAALLKQPLISPDSTTSVTKRKALNPGEAPGGR